MSITSTMSVVPPSEDDFFEIVGNNQTFKILSYEISVYNTFRVERNIFKRLQELELGRFGNPSALFFLSDDELATVCLSSLDEVKESCYDLKATSENLENVLQNEKVRLLEAHKKSPQLIHRLIGKVSFAMQYRRIQAPMQCYFTFSCIVYRLQ
ncbi:MAG: hypothetical protein ACLS3U_08460 [Lachnospiraceae bacterium]